MHWNGTIRPIILLLVVNLVGGALAGADAELAAPTQTYAIAAAAGSKTVPREKEALEAGVRAVVYGLPLVIMDITLKKATNVLRPKGMAAPVNQFANLREYPTAEFKQVVRANVDTLYSSAFLDLAGEPIVLSVPDTHGRYYLLPMFDAWTNVFASPGARTTGTRAGKFVITGPGWSGPLPAGMQELKSPTNMVWILGRTQTNGAEDYPAVHAIQNGYQLIPLSGFGKPYTAPEGGVDPNIDMKTPPVEQLQRMSAAQYFDELARLLQSNPPPTADAGVLAELAKIGVIPGRKFDVTKLDPVVAKGLERSVTVALERLQEAAKQTGTPVNGWRIPAMILGNYGTNYRARALIALIAFGANLPADAVYPTTFVDAQGKSLNGAHRYRLHFDKGLTPPIKAFWSVTLYDPQSFFVANPLNRYALSSWMPFKRNADGSLDLYIQHDSPGKSFEVNWLPAAAGDFNITLRMYWPTDQSPSIINGSWKPPGVIRVP
jgi:hypothetical protein